MITAKMTYHAEIERAERLAFIAEHIGVGTIQYKLTKNHHDNGTINCISSTGVLIVMDANSSTIVTAYCPTIAQASAAFRSNGFSRIPPMMEEKIRKNIKIMKKMSLTI